MDSARGIQTSLWMGCPIGSLRAHRLHAAPPERFAGLRVLLRLFAPRHPPRPLCSKQIRKKQQATERTRWMPWREKPKKDAETGETFRGSCMQAMSPEYPNGATHPE